MGGFSSINWDRSFFSILLHGVQAVRPESCDSWEGAASIALAVKTLGLGASVSSVHPRSTQDKLLLGLCQKSVLRDGERVEKKEIHQLWNLTGIGIEQRGLFTKHPMVRSEEEKKYRAVWRVPACLLLCYQSWIDFIFSQCPCSYYYLCSYSTSHRW